MVDVIAELEREHRNFARVAKRASSAVRAQRYLLVVALAGAPEPRVQADGFGPGEADARGHELLATDSTDTLPGRESLLVSEVASGRRRYGRLAAFFPPGQEFLHGEQELLDAYARLASAALDVSTALDAARQRGRIAEVLLELAWTLTELRDADAVAQAVGEATRTIVDADRGTVLLWDPEAKVMAIRGTVGWPPDLRPRAGDLRISPADTPEVAAIMSDPSRPRFYDSEASDPYLWRLLRDLRSQAMAVVGIARGDDPMGAVVAGWEKDSRLPRIDRPLFDRLAGMANQAATALENVRLMESVRHQATHGPLTGLPNRMLFRDRLQQALAERRRDGRRCALMFVDLDHFKVINDRFGHELGDEVLVEVARRLRRARREGDTVARYGGDEFTVLLPDIEGTETAGHVAAKLIEVLAPAVTTGGNEVHVTFSIGVAVVPNGASVPDNLLGRADQAMYEAKRMGGGRFALERTVQGY